MKDEYNWKPIGDQQFDTITLGERGDGWAVFFEAIICFEQQAPYPFIHFFPIVSSDLS
jgi:hypothetical protein